MPLPAHSAALHGRQASSVHGLLSLHWVRAVAGVQSTRQCPDLQVPLPPPSLHGLSSSLGLWTAAPFTHESSVQSSPSSAGSPESSTSARTPPLQTVRLQSPLVCSGASPSGAGLVAQDPERQLSSVQGSW